MTGQPKRKWSRPRPFGSDAAPLFYSQLDIQQTNPEESRHRLQEQSDTTQAIDGGYEFDRFYEYHVPPAEAVETRLRHSRWLSDRQRVGRALRVANVPESRLWRYWQCGSDCFIEVSDDGQRHRLKANYCGDRFCLPCMLARAKKICDALVSKAPAGRLRFITLTRRGDDASLSDALVDLRKSFVRLRESAFWKATVAGGVAFLEITRGAGGGHWHVHLHVLCSGVWVDKFRLSDAWRQASRGSFIVDVRPVNDRSKGVAYVAKYATKSISRSVIIDHQSLVEAIVSLRGSRVFMTFGSWHNLELDEPARDPVNWRPVGKLTTVVAAAQRGEEWAKGVLLSLGFKMFPDGSLGQIQPIDEETRPPPGKAREDSRS